jgi:hypothetical protein
MIFNRHKSPKKGLQVSQYVDNYIEYKKALKAEIGKLAPSQREEYENAKDTVSKFLKKSFITIFPSNCLATKPILSPQEDDAMERSYEVMAGYEGMMNEIIGERGIKIPPSTASYKFVRIVL